MKSGSYQHLPERTLFERFCDKYPSGLTPKKRQVLWQSAQAVNGKGKPQVSDFKAQLNCEYYFDRETSGAKYFTYDYSLERTEAIVNQESHQYITWLREAVMDRDFFVDKTGENMIPFLEAVVKMLFSDARYIRIKQRLYKWCNTYYEYRGDDSEKPRVVAIARIYDEFGTRYFSGKTRSFTYSGSVRKIEEAFRKAKSQVPQLPEQRNFPGIPCTNGVLGILWEGVTPLINFMEYDPFKHFFLGKPSVRFLVESNPRELEALFDFSNPYERDVFLRLISASLQDV